MVHITHHLLIGEKNPFIFGIYDVLHIELQFAAEEDQINFRLSEMWMREREEKFASHACYKNGIYGFTIKKENFA